MLSICPRTRCYLITDASPSSSSPGRCPDRPWRSEPLLLAQCTHICGPRALSQAPSSSFQSPASHGVSEYSCTRTGQCGVVTVSIHVPVIALDSRHRHPHFMASDPWRCLAVATALVSRWRSGFPDALNTLKVLKLTYGSINRGYFWSLDVETYGTHPHSACKAGGPATPLPTPSCGTTLCQQEQTPGSFRCFYSWICSSKHRVTVKS